MTILNQIYQNRKGISSVIGGFLVHLTMGTVYTFGNMNPYITSYLLFCSTSKTGSPSLSIWIYSLSQIFQGLLMSIGGIIQRRIGTKLTVLAGGWIMSTGVLLSYFSVKDSLWTMMLTYGILFGFGVGIAYGAALSNAMLWFPDKRGLIGGIVVAGFGGGSVLFNQVQTRYINPNNLPQNATIDHVKYFNEQSVLDRIPGCFILLGICYAVIQLIGSLMICEAPVFNKTSIQVKNDKYPTVRYSELEDEEQLLPDRQSPDNDQYQQEGFKLRDICSNRNFWVLYLTMFFLGIPISFISPLYKVFGETFIEDDFFLAVVGSMSSVFNSLGRIIWGIIGDKISTKSVISIQSSILGALLFTLTLSSYLHSKALYLLWVCLIFGFFSGTFVLFAIACSKSFGEKNMTINYGMLFTSLILSSVIGTFLVNALTSLHNYFVMFSIAGGAPVLGFIIVMCFYLEN